MYDKIPCTETSMRAISVFGVISPYPRDICVTVVKYAFVVALIGVNFMSSGTRKCFFQSMDWYTPRKNKNKHAWYTSKLAVDIGWIISPMLQDFFVYIL